MTDELRRARRRQTFLLVLIVCCFLGASAKLAYWQLGQHQMLTARADQEHQRPFNVPAGRGSIYAANGQLLALTRTEEAIVANPEVIDQANTADPGARDQAIARLAALLNLPADLLGDELTQSQGGHLVSFTYLQDGDGNRIYASDAQQKQITTWLQNDQLWGIGFLPESRRVYIDGDLAAQLLGFVQQDTGVGQYGLEAYYDALLAGKPGKFIAETDVDGNPLVNGDQTWQPPVNGADLTLTIDANIQWTAEQMLHEAIVQHQADGGSVIIVNPKTGAVLAMASEPRFDPNHYGDTPSYNLFVNPAVSNIYDPGSTIKAVTMAAALDLGLITPDTAFDDTGVYDVQGIPLHNWDNLAYGQETMTQVLQHSSNVGAIWVALQRLHADNFYRYLDRFGFGATTGVDLPTESAGLVPQEDERTDLTLAENSFGESIGVTPLQIVMAYAALANGGLLMRPYAVASATEGGHTSTFGPHPIRQVISPATAQTITKMLVDSTVDGEAQLALVPGYQIAAKTGTSTPLDDQNSSTYASVAGYAPASNPQFVMLVKIDHPQPVTLGGLVAAPLWHDLASWLLRYYRIPPDAAGTNP
ncbi:MAG TPA: penicillin-binding protein 2 [Ktedonobacterales bacterium]|jgi:cell division protein FtsI/penicillin-binding protein 2